MPTQPAVLGTARLNNFRLNYLPAALVPIRATKVGIYLSGVWITGSVKVGSVRISDIIDDAPNTCAFTFYGPTAPQPNQKLVVTLNRDTPIVLFSGTVQTIALSYVGRPSTVVWDCAAIDDTALANRRRPFGAWTATSATTIAIALVQTYAPDLSPAGIEAGLPPVDVILDGTEGMSGAFQQLAKLVGGYFKFEDGVVYLFTEFLENPVDPIDADHPFLNDPPMTASADVSQLRTRVYGKGHGENTLADTAALETLLPIADAVMFSPSGGRAIAIAQQLTYTGIDLGGEGSLIGPGVAPTVALVAVVVAGTGLGIGVYQYAFTFVTASGESLPSPLTSVTTSGGVPNPTVAPLAVNAPNGGSFNAATPIGEAQQFVYTYSTKASLVDFSQQTLPSAPVANTTVSNRDTLNPTRSAPVQITVPYSTDPRVQSLHIWLKSAESGGVVYRVAGSFANNTAGGLHAFLTAGTTSSSPAAPTTNTSAAGQNVAIGAVPLGPTGTTQRKIYRTVANGTQLKVQQTIANNVATDGVQDATADGGLGANAPIADTSGITQAAGQINAGATSILTAGASFARTSGGWVVLPGSQAIRYTGVSGNSLIGVPASGPGALVNTIRYGDHIVAAPLLTGVTGNGTAILRGTPINLWVQREALEAQADQAAVDVANARVRADGIYEGPLVVDERRGIPSLTALCDATLAIFATAIQTVRYATRDVKTKSGKPVTVNLASPPIVADLVIQEVQITEIDIAPGLAPRFDVTASSTRFSLDNLIRKLAKTLGGQ
jgi:hypothetical protein